MALTPTQIDPGEFNRILEGHKAVRDYIDQEKKRIQAEVDEAVATNSGAMIRSLQSVHDDWDLKMKSIIHDLDGMINDLMAVGTGLANVDQANVIK